MIKIKTENIMEWRKKNERETERERETDGRAEKSRAATTRIHTRNNNNNINVKQATLHSHFTYQPRFDPFVSFVGSQPHLSHIAPHTRTRTLLTFSFHEHVFKINYRRPPGRVCGAHVSVLFYQVDLLAHILFTPFWCEFIYCSAV